MLDVVELHHSTAILHHIFTFCNHVPKGLQGGVFSCGPEKNTGLAGYASSCGARDLPPQPPQGATASPGPAPGAAHVQPLDSSLAVIFPKPLSCLWLSLAFVAMDSSSKAMASLRSFGQLHTSQVRTFSEMT
uniref:Uncharacterized protein n=1 Tax=Sphaerodactylus townsendi TaxID=933632 RepID=A0ACB8FJF0_9SAUR